jgi:hypothetical protein
LDIHQHGERNWIYINVERELDIHQHGERNWIYINVERELDIHQHGERIGYTSTLKESGVISTWRERVWRNINIERNWRNSREGLEMYIINEEVWINIDADLIW